VIAVVLVGLGAQPALAGDGKQGPGGHQQERQYLALGDSVPFGFDPLVDPPVAAKYVGYPEKAAPGLKLALTNASCPGQSSSGFISLTGTDNGCFRFRQVPGAMHVSYAGSQLDYAVTFLRSHPKTRLVTITIGANDLFICADNTADRCASELPGVLAEYQANLTTILTSIRQVYQGKLVALTYYSPDYRDPVATGSVGAINQVATRVVQSFRGTTADGFTAFANVAAAYGGDTCAAGLLIRLKDGTCNIHPNKKGAKLLAATLTAAVKCDPVYRSRELQDLVGAAN
jgi:lysophospholipase L1-like esterase